MRKFFELYSIWSAVPTELSWSHFQELIRIDRKEEREFYELTLENEKIRINMLSQATSVDGQGVGSAYIEQVALVKENDDIFEVEVNSKKGNFDIYHIDTPNSRLISLAIGAEITMATVLLAVATSMNEVRMAIPNIPPLLSLK